MPPGGPKRDMPADLVILLAREPIMVLDFTPLFLGEQRIAERDALERVNQLRASRLVVDAVVVCAQEVEGIIPGLEPMIGLVRVFRGQRLRQVAGQGETALSDSQRESLAVMIVGQLIAGTQVRKHRIAFVFLATAGKPQLQTAISDAVRGFFVQLCLQGEAIQPGIAEVAIVLPV